MGSPMRNELVRRRTNFLYYESLDNSIFQNISSMSKGRKFVLRRRALKRKGSDLHQVPPLVLTWRIIPLGVAGVYRVRCLLQTSKSS